MVNYPEEINNDSEQTRLEEPVYSMEAIQFNPVQLHLLKMFSYAKSPSALEDIKKALSSYFAKRVEDDMDALWDEGKWDDNKNEEILKEHLRTPYN